MRDNERSIDEQLSFMRSYLQELKSNADEFRNLFGILKWFFIVTSIIPIAIFVVVIFSEFSFLAILQLIPLIIFALNIVLIAWFWSLCGRFASLQLWKIENDLNNQYSIRKQVQKSSLEILEAAKKRAGTMIENKGDNVIFNMGSGSISGVTQNKSVTLENNLAEALSLLVAYAEESKDVTAIRATREFADEASSANPNKSMLFELWGKITAAIPDVLSIVKIVEGIKKLF